MRIGSFSKTVRLSEIGQLTVAPDPLAKMAPAPGRWQPSVEFSQPFDWQRPARSERDGFECGVVTLTNIKARARPVGLNAHKNDAKARQMEFFPSHWRVGRPGQLRQTKPLPLDMYLKQTFSELRARARGQQEAHFAGTTVGLGICVADSANYFHFWTDLVGDIAFLRQMGMDVAQADHILMPWTGAKWQRDIAAMCGLPMERIVPLTSARFFRFDTIHAAQREQTAQLLSGWCVDAMRQQVGWTAQTPRPRGRKIFVTRGASARRALLNEAELVSIAASYGYEAIDCGALGVAEQQELFAAACAIVGPHGAGFTNIAWCQPTTVLLEFLNPNWTVPCFHDMAHQVGMTYMNILTRPVGGKRIWTESVLDEGTFRAALNWVETQL